MNRTRLTEDQIAARLPDIPGWGVRAGKLHRTVHFQNFVHAWGFMTQAALVSERLSHHPEWSNVYGRVTIDLATHDAGGVTALDFEWARAINIILDEMQQA